MSAEPHLDELTRLMTPPKRVYAPTSWDDAEETLEVRFPDSYKAFLNTYGQGGIKPELGVSDPRRPVSFRTMRRADTEVINDIAHEDLSGDMRPPYSGFPSSGRSLLGVAGNGDGHSLFLVVDDGVASNDELWIGDIRNGVWQRMESPFCCLLSDLVSGRNREALGEFNLRSWHLEPEWVSSPDGAQ